MEFLTAILVIITGYYAWQTNKTVKEMKAARYSDFMPALSIELQNSYNKGVTVSMKNIGQGVARNIKVQMPLYTETIKREELSVGTGFSYKFELQPVNIFPLHDHKRYLKVEYLDVFGRKFNSQALLIRKNEDDMHLSMEDWELITPDK